MVECIIRARRSRDKFFDASLFGDPVWDILLDLYLARLDQRRTTVSSLCIAAAVPATTALRYISALARSEIIIRQPSILDGRVVYVDLSEEAFSRMSEYFERFSELMSAALGA
jgi:hypothetical protein